MPADSSKNSAPGRPFEPGQSGNPGGKNPERERLRKYIVSEYGQESIDGIAEIARTAKSGKVKLDALIWLAEQTVGKAVQSVSGPDGGPVFDAPALMAALERAAKKGTGG